MDPVALALNVLNAVGVFAFAVSGALMGIRRRMDGVGIVTLALITSTGGGMVRDLLIGATPVAALVDLWMFGLAAVAALLVMVIAGEQGRLRWWLEVTDALGLGVFVVQGTVKGLAVGLNPVAAAVVGTITGVGGGVLRDVLANEVPLIFRRESNMYAAPAFVGGLILAGLVHVGWQPLILMVPIAVGISLIRILSIRFEWSIPGARLVTREEAAVMDRERAEEG